MLSARRRVPSLPGSPRCAASSPCVQRPSPTLSPRQVDHGLRSRPERPAIERASVGVPPDRLPAQNAPSDVSRLTRCPTAFELRDQGRPDQPRRPGSRERPCSSSQRRPALAHMVTPAAPHSPYELSHDCIASLLCPAPIPAQAHVAFDKADADLCHHPDGWPMDVEKTDDSWGAGMSETEKITLNLGPVDLGQIDLLVQEGFYSNRTDFIRTAIRNQLATARRGRQADGRPQDAWCSASSTILPGRTSRRCAPPGNSRSTCWAWRPSPMTSRPGTGPGDDRHHLPPSSGPSTRARRSSGHWPGESDRHDGDGLGSPSGSGISSEGRGAP